MSYPQPDEIRHIKTHARAIVVEAIADEDALSPDERTRVCIALLQLVDEMSPDPLPTSAATAGGIDFNRW